MGQRFHLQSSITCHIILWEALHLVILIIQKYLFSLAHISINFVSLYVKHSRQFQVNDLTQIVLRNTYWFIVGDYNSHNWRRHYQSITQRGKLLISTPIPHLNSSHAPGRSTYSGIAANNSRPAIIDFALTKTLPSAITTTLNSVLRSDNFQNWSR